MLSLKGARSQLMVGVATSSVMACAQWNSGGVRRFLSQAMRSSMSGLDASSFSADQARLRPDPGEIFQIASWFQGKRLLLGRFLSNWPSESLRSKEFLLKPVGQENPEFRTQYGITIKNRRCMRTSR